MARKNRKAIYFYPESWLGDMPLRMCSRAARSIWIDMLCAMHQSSDYGRCSTGGKPWTPQQIASAIGASDVHELVDALGELEANEVASRDENGAIYCRRMVRDGEKREMWRGQKRRQRKPAKADNHMDKQADIDAKSTPLSQRAISSYEEIRRPSPPGGGATPPGTPEKKKQRPPEPLCYGHVDEVRRQAAEWRKRKEAEAAQSAAKTAHVNTLEYSTCHQSATKNSHPSSKWHEKAASDTNKRLKPYRQASYATRSLSGPRPRPDAPSGPKAGSQRSPASRTPAFAPARTTTGSYAFTALTRLWPRS